MLIMREALTTSRFFLFYLVCEVHGCGSCAPFSDGLTTHIEALASGEGEGGCKSIMTCPNDKEITCSGAERCVTDVQEMYIECDGTRYYCCLLYTSPSPRDAHESRMPSSA